MAHMMTENITLENDRCIPRYLYKYGNLDNPIRLLDSLMNNRLYAGKFTEMNDPMEGTYRSEYFLTRDEFENNFNEKTRNRFCSLTTSPYFHLMWAYYAKGHTGYCIEIDMKESEYYEHNLRKIEYCIKQPVYNKDDEDSIRKILSHKYTDWAHEDEWRYFVDGFDYWENVKITRLFFRENIERYFYNFYNDIIKRINPDIEVRQILKEELNNHHIDTTNKLTSKL